MLKEVDECILCHSKKNEWCKVFTLNEDQDLMKCKKCGLIFNNFQRIDFETIYTNDYFDMDECVGSGGGFFKYSALEIGIQKMYKFAKTFIISVSDPKKSYKLIDIGCSFGFFLKMFQNEHNFAIFGVELNKMAAEEAQRQGLNIYLTPFEELIEIEMYDYITFFEFIEHTTSPIDVMKKINSILKPGGYAIFSTPDIGSIYFKILGKRWSSIHPAVHNYYFDVSTIQMLVKAANLEIISVHKSHIMWSDVFHFRKRLSEMFPLLKNVLRIISFMDPWILPFFNGGDLRVIVKKRT